MCKLFVEKNGIRASERITGHHRDTIGGFMKDLAAHSEKVTEFLLDEVELEETELDEFWSFVKKANGHSVGKKRQETCDKLTRKLCARCNKPNMLNYIR